MKKTIIKKISMLLAILLAFVSNGYVTKAAEVNSEYYMQLEYLREVGTPNELLLDFSPARVAQLYNTLYEHNEKRVVFSGYDSEIYKITENNENARGGNISTSDLKLTVATYEFIDENDKVIGMNAALTYEWLTNPIFHLTDAMIFTWDGTLFYDEGMYAQSCYDHPTYGVVSMDYVDSPAKAQSGSMGWYLSTAKPKGVSSYNYGGADICLMARNPFDTDTQLRSKMYFTYAHQIAGASISLGISSGSTPSVSAGVSVTAGDYHEQTYSYTYR